VRPVPAPCAATISEWIERVRRRIEHVNERIERNEETLQRVRDFLLQRPTEVCRPVTRGAGCGSRRTPLPPAAKSRERDAG
jgi:hypothetical protein